MHGVMEWLHRRRARRLIVVPPRSGPPGSGEACEAAPLGSPNTGQEAGQANLLIVLVDGCTIDTMAGTLGRSGYGVRVARGLNEALGNLRSVPVSLVLVCGSPASEPYLALRGATRAPILALLTGGSEAQVLDVLAAGADDCQPASIGNAEILSRVRALLRRTYW